MSGVVVLGLIVAAFCYVIKRRRHTMPHPIVAPYTEDKPGDEIRSPTPMPPGSLKLNPGANRNEEPAGDGPVEAGWMSKSL
jgi:hypothetical protein